jgi:hypothetical protein
MAMAAPTPPTPGISLPLPLLSSSAHGSRRGDMAMAIDCNHGNNNGDLTSAPLEESPLILGTDLMMSVDGGDVTSEERLKDRVMGRTGGRTGAGSTDEENRSHSDDSIAKYLPMLTSSVDSTLNKLDMDTGRYHPKSIDSIEHHPKTAGGGGVGGGGVGVGVGVNGSKLSKHSLMLSGMRSVSKDIEDEMSAAMDDRPTRTYSTTTSTTTTASTSEASTSEVHTDESVKIETTRTIERDSHVSSTFIPGSLASFSVSVQDHDCGEDKRLMSMIKPSAIGSPIGLPFYGHGGHVSHHRMFNSLDENDPHALMKAAATSKGDTTSMFDPSFLGVNSLDLYLDSGSRTGVTPMKKGGVPPKRLFYAPSPKGYNGGYSGNSVNLLGAHNRRCTGIKQEQDVFNILKDSDIMPAIEAAAEIVLLFTISNTSKEKELKNVENLLHAVVTDDLVLLNSAAQEIISTQTQGNGTRK